MLRLLLVLLACGCQASPQPQPPLAVPRSQAPLEEEPPAAPKSPKPTADKQFEFFWDEVELPGAENYLHGIATDLGEVVLVGDRHKGPLGVLHKDTLVIDEVSPFVGEPKDRAKITGAPEHDAVVAAFTDRKARVVYFQVLRLNTLRWEKAGRFDLPPSKALDDARKRSPSWVRMHDGELRLDLSDEVDTLKSYTLDFETLVWREVTPTKIDHGPCLMSSTYADDDRVRWGISSSDTSAKPCVAVRATTQDDWRIIEPPTDELIVMRSIRPMDERRFLVTRGISLTLSPFASRVDIVDVHAAQIHPLGKHKTGTELHVPGEPFLWLSKDAVVRFDPEHERFTQSAGPQLDFIPKWWITLDDHRVLFGGRDDENQARFVVAGFRPVP